MAPRGRLPASGVGARRSHRLRWFAFGVATLVMPALWVVLTRRWENLGDIALIELRTRDVLSPHPPLTGAYSRYGWSHPGPAAFEAFAVPTRILGSSSRALAVTVVGWNSAMLGLIGWLLARRGVAALVTGAAGLAVMVWTLDPLAMADPWNVTASLLPVVLFLVAIWAVGCSDPRGFGIALVTFVFIAQSHGGFGLAFSPLIGLLGWWEWRRRPERDPGATRGRRRPSWLVVAAVVLWLPVAYDTAAHWPGNLGRILRWVVSNDEPRVGWAASVRLIGQATSLSFAGHARFERRVFLTIDPVRWGTLPGLALVLLAGATWLAWRRGWQVERAVCVTVATAWLLSPWFVASLVRPLEYWLVEWLRPLVVMTWIAVALVGVRVLAMSARWSADSWPRRMLARHTWVPAAALAIGWAIGSGFHLTDALAASPGRETDRRLAVTLAAAAAPVLDDGRRTELTLGGDPFGALAYGAAIANVLDRRDREVCVRGEFVERFGPARACPAGETRRLLLRLESEVEAVPDGATVVGTYDPLSADQRSIADRLTRELSAILIADGRPNDVGLLRAPDAERVLVGASVALAERADDVRVLAGVRQTEGTRAVLLLLPAGVTTSD